MSPGDWPMNAIVSRRKRARASRREAREETPPTRTSPVSGTSRPATSASSVDLPEPDGPVTTVSRPGANALLTESSAVVTAVGACHAAQPRRARLRRPRGREASAPSPGDPAVERSSTTPSRDVTVARSTIPASRSAASGSRSQPPLPTTTAVRRLASLLSLTRPSRMWTTRSASSAERGSWLTIEGRDAILARELAEERVDAWRARLVELARRLVGDEESAAGRRARHRAQSAAALHPRAPRVAQSHDRGAPPSRGARASGRGAPPRDALKTERDGDQLLGRQLPGERTPVVLVCVPESLRRGTSQVPRRESDLRSIPATVILARPRPFETGDAPA